MNKLLLIPLLALSLAACQQKAPTPAPAPQPVPTKPTPLPPPRPVVTPPAPKPEPAPAPVSSGDWKQKCLPKVGCRVQSTANPATLIFSAYNGDTATMTVVIPRLVPYEIGIQTANGAGFIKPRCKKLNGDYTCTGTVVILRQDIDKVLKSPTIRVNWDSHSVTFSTTGLAEGLKALAR